MHREGYGLIWIYYPELEEVLALLKAKGLIEFGHVDLADAGGSIFRIPVYSYDQND